VKYCLGSDKPISRACLNEGFAAVAVPVEGGEIGTGNFDADLMAGLKYIGG
jgi:hypothetical protein